MSYAEMSGNLTGRDRVELLFLVGPFFMLPPSSPLEHLLTWEVASALPGSLASQPERGTKQLKTLKEKLGIGHFKVLSPERMFTE